MFADFALNASGKVVNEEASEMVVANRRNAKNTDTTEASNKVVSFLYLPFFFFYVDNLVDKLLIM